MASDRDRQRLYLALQTSLGEAAGTLMELLPPVGWADVARQSDIRALRGELKGEIAEVRGEIAELRGEIARLRAHVDAQFAKYIVANVPIMFGTAALVLGAAKLA